MALARSVLPVPGGPTRSTPLGILPPSFWNLGGSFRNSMISRSSSLASSTPATSWNVTLFCFSEISRARALPKDRALAPPPCICRMKKIQTPMKSSIGTHCSTMAQPGIGLGRLDVDLHAPVLERLDQVRVVGGEGPEGRAVAQPAGDIVPLERDLADFPGLHLLQEVREDDLPPGRLVLLKELEQEDDDESDHHPEGEVLVERIHTGKHTIRREGLRGHPEPDQAAVTGSRTARSGSSRCRPS